MDSSLRGAKARHGSQGCRSSVQGCQMARRARVVLATAAGARQVQAAHDQADAQSMTCCHTHMFVATITGLPRLRHPCTICDCQYGTCKGRQGKGWAGQWRRWLDIRLACAKTGSCRAPSPGCMRPCCWRSAARQAAHASHRPCAARGRSRPHASAKGSSLPWLNPPAHSLS